MQKIWFFDFEARQWSCKFTTGGNAEWTFGHAIKRGKYLYAYGTQHNNSTEESLVAVSFEHTCPAAVHALYLSTVSMLGCDTDCARKMHIVQLLSDQTRQRKHRQQIYSSFGLPMPSVCKIWDCRFSGLPCSLRHAT